MGTDANCQTVLTDNRVGLTDGAAPALGRLFAAENTIFVWVKEGDYHAVRVDRKHTQDKWADVQFLLGRLLDDEHNGVDLLGSTRPRP
jgi:hypothetical protein